MAEIEQRSAEWFQQRSGKITASRFADVISIGRNGKPLQARHDYMLQLAFERTAGIAKQSIGSKATCWGTEVESYAREAYELETGNLVSEVGFVIHSDFDYIGGSADGFVGDAGLIEIKCPHDEKVHVRTWLEGMPDGHMPQVQGNLLVTKRSWADFISYDPRAGERWRLFVQRVQRNDEYIDKTLLPGLLQFELELRAMVKQLEEKAA